jgi:putative colanic acid biosynthesis UDP-glucose lipid carrier transferase
MRHKGLLKEHASLLNFVLRLVDWAAIFLSGVVAFYISGTDDYFMSIGRPGMPTIYVYALVLAVLLSAAIFPLVSVYRPWRGASVFGGLRLVAFGWLIVAFALAALALMTKTGAHYSRMWAGVWFLGGWFSLVTFRLALRLLLRWMRSKGYNRRRLVIVGTGELAKEVAERINAATWTGLEILGFFSGVEQECHQASSKGAPIIGGYSELPAYVQENKVDQVWVAMPLKEEDAVKSVLHELRHCTADIRFIPDISGFQLLNHSITDVAGLPVFNLSVSPMEGLNLWLKEIEDRVLAFLILAVASPLMCLIALGVKLSSPGPVFYRQVRVSWNGKVFEMLKFRSMRVNTENETGPVWATKGESRATGFGSLLRNTSLDELPQFINVLRGDMSIVGPRPERPVFVDRFKDEVPDYMKKHLVKAGITGWAQVNGWRGDTDVKKRVEYDIYYIEHWSVWFDMKIMWLTLFRGFVHQNAY